MTQLYSKSINEILNEIKGYNTDTILIVVDEKVWDIYQHQIPFELELKNKDVHLFRAVSGEKAKSFFEFEAGIEFFLEKGIHRNAHLIALGGGATSDYAGFIAANLLRGISWSVIPTTLLSMIDASIGGKVAINSVFGKNLIGAFHKPARVYFNSSFLHSLPKEQLQSGQGELLKYGFLSKEIYDHIIKQGSVDELILMCAEYKLNITEEDFRETGKRKYLNLGHTIGHAIEKFYNISHGEAVVLGMAVIFELFDQKQYLNSLKLMIEKLGVDKIVVPWEKDGLDVDNLFPFVEKDKKVLDKNTLDLVMVKEIGAPYLYSIDLAELKALMHKTKPGIDALEF